ncbi:MAG TPA: ABC transporter substrate-binding protein [Burkholderiales bacterium]
MAMQRFAVLAWLASVTLLAQAQPAAKLQRIGVIYDSGRYQSMVEGLRAGLKDHGMAEGKSFVLHLRDIKEDLAEAQAAAKQLVSERVDVLFTVTTSVSKLASEATGDVSIVFYVGDDPVRQGLVQTLARPGGRLTGIHHRRVELVPKRLELLHQLLPRAHKIISFYNPATAVAGHSMNLARQAASKLGLELMERPVRSVDELISGVRALRPGDADAYFLIGDPTATRGTLQIMPDARQRRLPVVAQDFKLFDAGALAVYGANYHDVGRSAARYVKLVLAGARPADTPVETYEKVELAISLRVAKELGISIPEPMVVRADRVIR